MSETQVAQEQQLRPDADFAHLQQQYGGQYVARRGADVIASAERYDDLSDRLQEMKVDWRDIVVEYVEPAEVVCVY